MIEKKYNKKRLDHFVSLQRGHDLTESDRKNGNVPVIGSAGPNGFHDTIIVDKPGVTIGRSGASFGNVFYCDEPHWPHNTVLYVTDYKGNFPLFVYYALKNIEFKPFNSGSAQASLNRNYISHIEIHVPSLVTQKAIAHILGTLDDKIELNRRMNETLESIARAIFTSWFINFDPVRAKAETRQPEGMDAATAALFPSEFETVEGQEIPKGWQIKPIGDILEVKGGSTPSTENESYWGGNIPFCTPKDLSNSKTPFILSTERTITELGVGEISSGILPLGTVLLSSRAPIGYVSITIAPISINQGFIALIPNESCNNYFIFEWLKANMELIIGNANGTTFLEISKKNFKPLSLCLPPKKLIRAYSLLINPIFTKIKVSLPKYRVRNISYC